MGMKHLLDEIDDLPPLLQLLVWITFFWLEMSIVVIFTHCLERKRQKKIMDSQKLSTAGRWEYKTKEDE